MRRMWFVGGWIDCLSLDWYEEDVVCRRVDWMVVFWWKQVI